MASAPGRGAFEAQLVHQPLHRARVISMPSWHTCSPRRTTANPLAVEPWWEDRPLRLRIARRLHDYSHLEHDKGPSVRPWVLDGEEFGGGPDNEPLVGSVQPVAWIADEIIAEAERVVAGQNAGWGSLRRPG